MSDPDDAVYSITDDDSASSGGEDIGEISNGVVCVLGTSTIALLTKIRLQIHFPPRHLYSANGNIILAWLAIRCQETDLVSFFALKKHARSGLSQLSGWYPCKCRDCECRSPVIRRVLGTYTSDQRFLDKKKSYSKQQYDPPPFSDMFSDTLCMYVVCPWKL